MISRQRISNVSSYFLFAINSSEIIITLDDLNVETSTWDCHLFEFGNYAIKFDIMENIIYGDTQQIITWSNGITVDRYFIRRSSWL